MIVIADLHMKEESADTVLQRVLPGAAGAAVEEGSRELAILGDLLTFRYKVDARLQNLLIDVFKRIVASGIYVRIIPGNHDQYEVGGRNALEPLDEIQGVDVYTTPTVDKDGYWLPYRKRPEDLAAALEMFRQQPAPDVPMVLYGHFGVHGAMMNDLVKDGESLPVSTFQNFHTVLLGHYHGRQTLGNCHFVGSTHQTKADEAGRDNGYAIWNGSQLSYVTTDWGKRYHSFKVAPGEEGQIDLSGVRPGDEVRVQTATGVDPEGIGKMLTSAGIENHVVTPDVEVIEARLDVPAGAGVKSYGQAYVDIQETSLDKGRLMQVFGELTQ